MRPTFVPPIRFPKFQMFGGKMEMPKYSPFYGVAKMKPLPVWQAIPSLAHGFQPFRFKSPKGLKITLFDIEVL